MKPKHLIVGAVMTAFSLLALAAPESSPAATAPAGSTTATTTHAAPKAAVKPVKKANPSEQGKTRGLKSKKGKECETDAGCQSGQ